MNILLLGSGGREHALAWKIRQSPILGRLFIAPGNGGTATLGENLPLDPMDFHAVRESVLRNQIDLVLVGPEAPLVAGIQDFFSADPALKDVMLIGPSKAGAMLEGSKRVANEFMERHSIPTALFFSVTADRVEEGISFLQRMIPPYVLKADGLAAGKGVLILDSQEEAEKELRDMLNGKFGPASETVVIEEFMSGIEASVFVLTDGQSYLILPEAKDYKRIGEGNTGLNTGGMGAVSPVPFADKDFLQKVEDRIIRPTVAGLKKEKIPYVGFLYIGLMNIDGDPFVVEYNVRMGDPETQVVIPRIESDLLDLLRSAGRKDLHNQTIRVSPETACTVVMASGGYPGSYEKNKKIAGLGETGDCLVFHAGTRFAEGAFYTSGGRVLALTGMGKDRQDALAKCYTCADKIDFEKKYFRRDIGFDL